MHMCMLYMLTCYMYALRSGRVYVDSELRRRRGPAPEKQQKLCALACRVRGAKLSPALVLLISRVDVNRFYPKTPLS